MTTATAGADLLLPAPRAPALPLLPLAITTALPALPLLLLALLAPLDGLSVARPPAADAALPAAFPLVIVSAAGSAGGAE